MDYAHEMVIPSEHLPFKIFQFEGKDGNYSRDRHWHRSVEIFAVLKGKLDFYLNDSRYRMTAGKFIIVNSNEVHSIWSPKPNFTVVVQIPQKLFENYYTDENFIWFSHDEREEDPELTSLIGEMYAVYEEKEMGYELRAQSLFYRLQYELVTKYRTADGQSQLVKRSRNLDRLSMITSYIRDNYREEISLESLARIFGYSPVYLSRMFRKYAKINYRDYFQNVRLEYAREELLHADKTISQIALDNGFPNSKALANNFRKKYGILPSEFQSQNKRLTK